MANTGWHLPGNSVANSPTSAPTPSEAWSNQSYIRANDSNYASVSLNTNDAPNADVYSDYIRAYSFGFSADISASAQIDGIRWRVYARKTNTVGSPVIDDHRAYGAYGSTLRGNNQSAGANYSTSFTYHYFGGTSDLLGASFTTGEIRNASFGVANVFRCDYQSAKAIGLLEVDFVQCIIYFTEPPDAPTDALATQSDADVEVTWTDNASDEDNYEVSVSVNGGSYSVLSAAIAADAVSYTDTTGYLDGDTLDYRVRALKSSGPDSGYSNAAQITYQLDTDIAAAVATLNLAAQSAGVVFDAGVDATQATLNLSTFNAVIVAGPNVNAALATLSITPLTATIYSGPPLNWGRYQEDIQP